METLIKRHFWVINLLGLGIIAWLAAGSVNAGVGVLLAKAGRGEDKVNIAAATGDTRVQKRLTDGRVHETSGAEMYGRSIFLIEEPPEPEEAEETDQKAKKVRTAWAPRSRWKRPTNRRRCRSNFWVRWW